ncbi:hypothetical protein VP01_253g2 [Puccinia sorghi]|uniref:Uncharacterized protein n=1 Tax=Puccinia sorghi TaxID=27349 RepID=A0A0L6V5X8_9BASI|nr:hypothetical protein VP01_253g2 [Puccinia sorghi]
MVSSSSMVVAGLTSGRLSVGLSWFLGLSVGVGSSFFLIISSFFDGGRGLEWLEWGNWGLLGTYFGGWGVVEVCSGVWWCDGNKFQVTFSNIDSNSRKRLAPCHLTCIHLTFGMMEKDPKINQQCLIKKWPDVKVNKYKGIPMEGHWESLVFCIFFLIVRVPTSNNPNVSFKYSRSDYLIYPVLLCVFSSICNPHLFILTVHSAASHFATKTPINPPNSCCGSFLESFFLQFSKNKKTFNKAIGFEVLLNKNDSSLPHSFSLFFNGHFVLFIAIKPHILWPPIPPDISPKMRETQHSSHTHRMMTSEIMQNHTYLKAYRYYVQVSQHPKPFFKHYSAILSAHLCVFFCINPLSMIEYLKFHPHRYIRNNILKFFSVLLIFFWIDLNLKVSSKVCPLNFINYYINYSIKVFLIISYYINCIRQCSNYVNYPLILSKYAFEACKSHYRVIGSTQIMCQKYLFCSRYVTINDIFPLLSHFLGLSASPKVIQKSAKKTTKALDYVTPLQPVRLEVTGASYSVREKWRMKGRPNYINSAFYVPVTRYHHLPPSTLSLSTWHTSLVIIPVFITLFSLHLFYKRSNLAGLLSCTSVYYLFFDCFLLEICPVNLLQTFLINTQSKHNSVFGSTIKIGDFINGMIELKNLNDLIDHEELLSHWSYPISFAEYYHGCLFFFEVYSCKCALLQLLTGKLLHACRYLLPPFQQSHVLFGVVGFSSHVHIQIVNTSIGAVFYINTCASFYFFSTTSTPHHVFKINTFSIWLVELTLWCVLQFYVHDGYLFITGSSLDFFTKEAKMRFLLPDSAVYLIVCPCNIDHVSPINIIYWVIFLRGSFNGGVTRVPRGSVDPSHCTINPADYTSTVDHFRLLTKNKQAPCHPTSADYWNKR